MSEPLIVFRAVHGRDKQALLKRTLVVECEVQLKDRFKNCFPLIPIALTPEGHLKCQLLETAFLEPLKSGSWTACFVLDNEKYLFEPQLQIHLPFVSLTVPHLFHLQKRKNFRYSLAEEDRGHFVITHHNDHGSAQKCRLLDLSTRGCAIEMPADTAALQVNDRLSGEVLLGHYPPIHIEGLVRNMRQKGLTQMVFGIEFHLKNDEHAINEALTELQKSLHFRRVG
ncbi:MAG: PilZ domain-containing protein [Bdellovibrio sp.]